VFEVCSATNDRPGGHRRNEQLVRQRYVDEPDVHAPSVVTLNAVANAAAVNDYLMSVTGLLDDGELCGARSIRAPTPSLVISHAAILTAPSAPLPGGWAPNDG
jgi:hypothetical protein